MTEDDTFSILCRISFKELIKLIQDEDDTFSGTIYDKFSDPELAYLHQHKWTELEFKKAWRNEKLQNEPDIINSHWWPGFEHSLKTQDE